MTPEQWRQIERIYNAALGREVDERIAFIAQACGGDEALRREVESLLAAREQMGSFLVSPATKTVAGLIVEEQAQAPVGQRISHYQVDSLLGAGGMGEVYLAQDMRLGRRVALKLLPREFTQDRERVQRFEREARAASALNHPNIITIHEIGQVSGIHFIATEYIEGETLRQRMQQRPMKLPEVLDAGIQIASALEAAHHAGVVHRDIKPENVMVRGDGIVKVLDFGPAKLLERKIVEQSTPGAGGISTEAVAHSRAGAVIGTAKYMSPEQARGEEVDVRSDIFSLGAVIYEMAAGRAPFEGATANEVIAAILDQKPSPLSAYSREVPAGLERIVSQALAKDREERYQSVKDLALELKRLRQEMEIKRLTAGLRTSASARRRIMSVAGAGAVLLATLIWLNLGGWRERLLGWANPGRIVSLAVLPLENRSGDPEQEYLADGMTDELISSLSKIGALRVRSRTSVMQYKGARKPLPEIARELKVDAVVEGAVMRSGDRVRITARLIEATTDQQVWAQSYERDLRDVLALQSEAARDIAQEIKVRLTPQDQTRLASGRAVNPEAYVAYLRGRYFWNLRGQEVKKAIEYFEQAIAKDPSYAPAYAGLADSYIILAGGTLPPREAMPKAKEAIMKALAIDDTLAESHTSLAMVKWHYDRDWLGAEKEFKRAIELTPNYPTARQWYGLHLLYRGRFEEGRAELKLAQNLDPISPAIISAEASYFFHTQQYDQAIEHYRKTLEIYPNNVSTQRNIGVIYLLSGRYEEALVQCQKVDEMTKTPNSPWLLSCYGCAYAGLGRKEEARGMLNKLIELSKKSYVRLTEVANICVCLGEKERAIEWLEKAYEERLSLTDLKVNHFWDSLRSDPRFQDLLRRMNIPP